MYHSYLPWLWEVAFSVKYVTGYTVFFINKDLFLDKILAVCVLDAAGFCTVDKHI